MSLDDMLVDDDGDLELDLDHDAAEEEGEKKQDAAVNEAADGKGDSGRQGGPDPAPKPEPHASEQPGGAGAGGGRGRGRERGGKNGKGKGNARQVQCEGCYGWFPIADMPVGFNFCWADKRALDNIYNASRAQGKTDWWQSTRYNDERRYRVLKRYHALHPELKNEANAAAAGKGRGGGKGNKRRGGRGYTFDIAAYIESTESATEVLRDVVKRGMSKAVFSTLVFSDTMLRPLHGSFQNSQSACEYWEKRRAEKEAVVSKDATGDETVELEVDNTSTTRDRFSNIKRVEGRDKDIKGATQQNVGRLHRKLMTGMESHGRATEKVSMAEMAQRMASCSSGSGSAFDAIKMGMQRVEDLLDDAQDEEAVDEEQPQDGKSGDKPEQAAEAAEREQADNRANKKNNKSFLDDRSVAAAIRSQNTWIDGMKAKLETSLASSKTIKQSIAEGNFANEFKNELAIMRTRQMAVEKVMATAEQTGGTPKGMAQLTAFLAQFGPGLSPKKLPSKGSDSASVTELTLGRKPPCPKFKELVTLAKLQADTEDYYSASSNAELKEITNRLKEPKAALGELAAMFGVSLRDLEKGLKTKVEEAAKRKRQWQAEGSGGPSGSRNVRPKPGSLYEMVGSKALEGKTSEIAHCDLSRGLPAEFSITDPSVARLPAGHELLTEQSEGAKWAFGFHKSFKNTQLRMLDKAPSRAQRALEPLSLAHKSAEGIRGLSPNFSCIGAGDVADELSNEAREVMESVLTCHVFVIASGYTRVANEKQYMSCLRLSLQGTRTVVMMRMLALCEVMQERGVTDMSQSKIWTFLQNATVEILAEVLKRGAVWHGTVGAGDILFVPPGFVLWESVVGEKDVCGIRMPILQNSPAMMAEFRDLQCHCVEYKKQSLEHILRVLEVVAAKAAAVAEQPGVVAAKAEGAQEKQQQQEGAQEKQQQKDAEVEQEENSQDAKENSQDPKQAKENSQDAKATKENSQDAKEVKENIRDAMLD